MDSQQQPVVDQVVFHVAEGQPSVELSSIRVVSVMNSKVDFCSHQDTAQSQLGGVSASTGETKSPPGLERQKVR